MIQYTPRQCSVGGSNAGSPNGLAAVPAQADRDNAAAIRMAVKANFATLIGPTPS